MNNTLLKVVKKKDDYEIINISSFNGYYTIIRKTCNRDQIIQTGNIYVDGSFHLKTIGDGDYIISYNLGQDEDVDREIVITHNTKLLSVVIRDIKELLCNCKCAPVDCGESDNRNCLDYQLLFENLILLTHLTQTINTDKDNKYVILQAINAAYKSLKCDFNELYCEKQIEFRIKGEYSYDTKLIKKIIAINYLMLYFYEREITSLSEENVAYLNKIYDYKTISECVTKAGINIFNMEFIFMEHFYTDEVPPFTCNDTCFLPIELPSTSVYEFDVNTQLNGIYDTISLKNNCITDEAVLNTVLYKDDDFIVIAKIQGIKNPLVVAPDGLVTFNIVFIGTKPDYNIINVPFIYGGTLVHTYQIVFKETIQVTNTPPVITDVIKPIENGEVYTFTVADFENHFTDADGHALGKVILVGDTQRFTLGGIPYQSGTVITRNNITGLKYTPLPTDDFYSVVLNWTAFDELGLQEQ